MGFGSLLIGYLITFVLYLTANAIGVGAPVLLLGIAVMLSGIRKLKRYCKSFFFAELALYPTLVTSLFRLSEMLRDWFLWNLPFLNQTTENAVGWCEFLCFMIFHAAVLSSVRELALEVELPKTANSAMRNLIAVSLYAVVYLLVQMPLSFMDGVRSYFTLSLTVLNLLYVLLNLFLFLSCTKNICPEGGEEPPKVEYRWKLLNRIGDKFAKTQEDAVQKQREEIQTLLQKRNGGKKK